MLRPAGAKFSAGDAVLALRNQSTDVHAATVISVKVDRSGNATYKVRWSKWPSEMFDSWVEEEKVELAPSDHNSDAANSSAVASHGGSSSKCPPQGRPTKKPINATHTKESATSTAFSISVKQSQHPKAPMTGEPARSSSSSTSGENKPPKRPITVVNTGTDAKTKAASAVKESDAILSAASEGTHKYRVGDTVEATKGFQVLEAKVMELDYRRGSNYYRLRWMKWSDTDMYDTWIQEGEISRKVEVKVPEAPKHEVNDIDVNELWNAATKKGSKSSSKRPINAAVNSKEAGKDSASKKKTEVSTKGASGKTASAAAAKGNAGAKGASGAKVGESKSKSDTNVGEGNKSSSTSKSKSEFEGMIFATRAVGVNAKGRQKALGKGKRSSHTGEEEDDDDENRKKKKSKKGHHDDDDTAAAASKGTMAVLQGADKLFAGARRGARGIKAAAEKHRRRITLAPSSKEYDHFQKNLLKFDPTLKDRQRLLDSYIEDHAYRWLWQMQTGSNILLFGVGDKRPLMHRFIQKCLMGQWTLGIDGDTDAPATSNRVVKSLLESINAKVGRPNLSSEYLTLQQYTRALCELLDTHYGRTKTATEHRGSSGICGGISSGNIGGGNNKGADGVEMPPVWENAEEELDDEELEELAAATAAAASASASASTSATASATAGTNTDNDNNNSGGAVADGLMTTGMWGLRKRDAPIPAKVSSSTSGNLAVDMVADPRWGGRYAHAKARVNIVVFSIDGESLRSADSQECLSILARCESVSVIAICESVNTPFLWTPESLFNFNWLYYNVPTYEPFEYKPLDAGSAGSGGNTKEFTGGTKALEFILKSLTKRHTELLLILSKDALKQYDAADSGGAGAGGGSSSGVGVGGGEDHGVGDSTSSYRGISLEDLLNETSKLVVARSMPELRTLLMELTDQKLVNIVHDAQRRQFAWITLPIRALRKFVG